MTAVVAVGELVEVTERHLELLEPQTAKTWSRYVDEWLASVTGAVPSVHTLRAYRADAEAWRAWCEQYDIDPLRAGKTHVDVYSKMLASTPSARTRKPLGAATVARRISAVASLFVFLVDEGVAAEVPVRKKARPKVSKDSTTRGLSRDEAQKLRRRLRCESVTDRAVVEMLLCEGLRVTELRDLNIGAVGVNAGATTLKVDGKGRKVRELVLSAPVVAAVDRMLGDRAAAAGVAIEELDPDAALFVRVSGERFTQRSVCRLLQRVARAAGLREAGSITPHVMRHSCTTLMLDAGVPLHVVRDQMGHSGTGTTERYDRARGALARTGVHALAAWIDPES